MNSDKRIIIDELLARVNSSPFVLVFDYTGTTVAQFANLRTKLSESGAKCQIAKNTLMAQAIKEAGLPDISDKLAGQLAYVTGSSDVVAAAKAIAENIKATKKGEIRVGILDNAILDAAQINSLAALPSRDALLSMLLGAINGVGSALARVIQAKIDKENGGEEAPATEEAPAAE